MCLVWTVVPFECLVDWESSGNRPGSRQGKRRKEWKVLPTNFCSKTYTRHHNKQTKKKSFVIFLFRFKVISEISILSYLLLCIVLAGVSLFLNTLAEPPRVVSEKLGLVSMRNPVLTLTVYNMFKLSQGGYLLPYISLEEDMPWFTQEQGSIEYSSCHDVIVLFYTSSLYQSFTSHPYSSFIATPSISRQTHRNSLT